MTTLSQNKQYLVQIFEACYSGQHFIGEKVVINDEGIRQYLEEHTFTEHVITEVLKKHEYSTSIDVIIIIKEQNEDGSFDSYSEL